MDFSTGFLRGAILLVTLATLTTTAKPAAAAIFDTQWALENKGQSVCDFRGQDCITGNSGVDIKYEPVRSSDCSNVIVAVLDSGVDLLHPDLAGNLLPGKNFVGDTVTDDPQDDNLHGTHVTGIIAGNGTETSGVVGVCHRAKVLPIKVGDDQGNLTDADIIEGISYAVSQGARVINGSFGGSQSDSIMKAAIAKEKETLFVFAAGNGDDLTGLGFDIDKRPSYPAAYGLANIISVAATDAQDRLASFSNFGVNRVQLAAPGVNIISSLPMKATAEMTQYGIPTGSGSLDGTSMATPYVTGALAMFISANPTMKAADVKAQLLKSVDKLDVLAGKVQSGGRLNLAKLMGVSR